MVFTTHILAFPLIIVLWLNDMYLSLVVLRLLLAHVPGVWARNIHAHLLPMTDPVVQAVGRKLADYQARSIPAWLPWLVIVLALSIIRILLIGILKAMA